MEEPGIAQEAKIVEDPSMLIVALGGRVLAMEPATGAVRWEHPVGAEEVEIAIQDGRVYASTGEALSCFEYQTGEALFRSRIPARFRGRPTMVVQDGRIFVATRGEVCCFYTDGKLAWRDGLGGRGIGSVALGFPGNVRQADDRGRE